MYTYAVVVDTCGQGAPYPNVFATSLKGYSYAFLVGAAAGASSLTLPALEQYILTPNQANPLMAVTVAADPNLESFAPNYESQTTTFQLIFARSQLDNPLHVGQPCPNITPSPSPSATASASASASTAPSAAPSPTPTSMPTTSAQVDWYFNFYSIDNTGRIILDSLGPGGANDDSYPAPAIDTQTTNQYPLFKAVGPSVPTDPSAQIEGGEIDNYL